MINCRYHGLALLTLFSFATDLPAQIGPMPSTYRYARVRWVPSTLYSDGSFSPASEPTGTGMFADAKMKTDFPGWRTFSADDGVIYVTSEIYPEMPAVGSPFSFTASHPIYGSYMGATHVFYDVSGGPCWQPWRHGEGPAPGLWTLPLNDGTSAFHFYIVDIMIADRPSARTFVTCDSDDLVNSALKDRNFEVKATYLEGNALAGGCAVEGTFPASFSYHLTTWADARDWGPGSIACSSELPEGPMQIEFKVEGYEPSTAWVNVEGGKGTLWRPLLYPELDTDAPGATELLPVTTFPPAFSQEARIKRLSGEVDFVMGSLGGTLDRNGDGVVDGADLIERSE